MTQFPVLSSQRQQRPFDAAADSLEVHGEKSAWPAPPDATGSDKSLHASCWHVVGCILRVHASLHDVYVFTQGPPAGV